MPRRCCQNEDGQPEGRTQRNRHRADDNQSSDKTSRHEQHDDENEAECGDTRNQEVVSGSVHKVFYGRRGAGKINIAVFQRRALERLLGRGP